MTSQFRISVGMALLAALASGGSACAQESPAPNPPAKPALLQTQPTNGVAAPCVQPAPMVRLQDYDGPFRKTIGFFTGKVELKTVHPPTPPHFKPGTLLCTLTLKDKFRIFVRASYDPATIVNTAFNAELSQAQDGDPTFGLGMAGYGRRFVAAYTDQTSFGFFKGVLYPSIFREDPRYYRMGEGNSGKRLLHAMEHVVVTHRDNGGLMFNFSEWVGNASAMSLSNLYHPGNRRGFIPTARNMGTAAEFDVGFDVLREFWPEVARKFKLPFRAEPPGDATPNPAVK